MFVLRLPERPSVAMAMVAMSDLWEIGRDDDRGERGEMVAMVALIKGVGASVVTDVVGFQKHAIDGAAKDQPPPASPAHPLQWAQVGKTWTRDVSSPTHWDANTSSPADVELLG
jgi:hypothetical protein